MKVYSNINTLAKLQAVANEIGLGGVLVDGELGDITISDLFKKLVTEGKAVEILQIITRDEEADFAEMSFKEIKEIISSLFTDILELLPESVQTKLKSSL